MIKLGRSMCLLVAFAFLFSCSVDAADAPKRLLVVTHSGGFMHDSVLSAERMIEKVAPKHGFTVTCYRFTGDPDAEVTTVRKVDGREEKMTTTALAQYSERFQKLMGEPVTREQCGRVNATTLKNFDDVFFFTSSPWFPNQGTHPLTRQELDELLTWVREGGGFAAAHSGSDTLHNTAYSELVGATFGGHPWVQKVRLHVEDAGHPAASGLTEGGEIFDEIYQFGAKAGAPDYVPLRIQPYSRERLHIILSVDNASIDITKGMRADNDYPVAWCQEFGRGRSFYTSLGHHKAVWDDERFQAHLMGGLKWAAGLAPGDASPSIKTAPQAK